MARLQPVLSPAELALVDQMAELTQSKRTDVIKSALHPEPKDPRDTARVARDVARY